MRRYKSRHPKRSQWNWLRRSKELCATFRESSSSLLLVYMSAHWTQNKTRKLSGRNSASKHHQTLNLSVGHSFRAFVSGPDKQFNSCSVPSLENPPNQRQNTSYTNSNQISASWASGVTEQHNHQHKQGIRLPRCQPPSCRGVLKLDLWRAVIG